MKTLIIEEREDPSNDNGGNVDATIDTVTLGADGQVTVALTADVKAGKTYTVTISKLNAATATWIKVGTVVAKVEANDLDAAVANAASMMVKDTEYRATCGGVESATVVKG